MSRVTRVHGLVVAVGGALGATARWGVDRWLTDVRIAGVDAFPWGLVVVNVLGSFVLGLVAFAVASGRRGLLQLGVGVGFCGGFTTFSSFAVAAVDLADADRPAATIAFVVGSIVAGVGAFVAGAAVRAPVERGPV